MTSTMLGTFHAALKARCWSSTGLVSWHSRASRDIPCTIPNHPCHSIATVYARRVLTGIMHEQTLPRASVRLADINPRARWMLCCIKAVARRYLGLNSRASLPRTGELTQIRARTHARHRSLPRRHIAHIALCGRIPHLLLETRRSTTPHTDTRVQTSGAWNSNRTRGAKKPDRRRVSAPRPGHAEIQERRTGTSHVFYLRTASSTSLREENAYIHVRAAKKR